MKEHAATISQANQHVANPAGVAFLRIAFRASVVMTVGVIGLIGLWAIAALVGGALSAGGPVELFQGWFSAVTGS